MIIPSFYNFLKGLDVLIGYYEYGILGCTAAEPDV
jgi:hypothetical protein